MSERINAAPGIETGAAKDINLTSNDNGIRDEHEAHSNKPVAATDSKKSTPGNSDSAANLLITIGERAELFIDERGMPHARVETKGAKPILRIRGREFKQFLAGELYSEHKKAASSEAKSVALGVLEAKAAHQGKRHTLHNRIAQVGETIWLDMADDKWRAIEITKDGWRIDSDPPILFRRYPHQSPLPDPVGGGSLELLKPFLNLKNVDKSNFEDAYEDFDLICAWLVLALFADVPRWLLLLTGAQGTAKTTTARLLRSLIDPSSIFSVSFGRNEDSLIRAADHHAIPIFDNLSRIPQWASDLLCRLVTGAAFESRVLYTDDDSMLIHCKRAMIATGINVPGNAPDLFDRVLHIELARIPKQVRKTEKTLFVEFDRLRPQIIGALLDAVVGTLTQLPSVKIDELPRMADAAKIACAYAEWSGIGMDKMVKALNENAEKRTEEIIESDPLASAVRAYVKGETSLTPTVLYKELSPASPPDDWPRNAAAMGKRLKVLQTTFYGIGIEVVFDKTSLGRLIKLSKI